MMKEGKRRTPLSSHLHTNAPPLALPEEEKKEEMMMDYDNKEEIDVDEIDVDDLEIGLRRRQQQQQQHQAGTRQSNSTTNNNNTKITICCPLTKQPLREPVVHPKGVTFELEAIEETFGSGCICYPNRALRDYLDPTTDSARELNANSIHKKGIFYCSITTDLLRDPVIDPEGNTFERYAIVDWIKQHGDSPITRNPLQVQQLYDNTTLLTVLIQEVQQQQKRQQQKQKDSQRQKRQQQEQQVDGGTDSTQDDDDDYDDDDDDAEIEDWRNEVSRIPTVDPPLTESQVQEALQPPPVPNPPLPVIREALGQQPPPSEVPNPPLAAIQEALLEEEPSPQQETTNIQVNTARVPSSTTTRTSTRTSSSRRSRNNAASINRPPQPLLFQELEQVQADEQELRRSHQEADQHLQHLLHRHKTKIIAMIAVFVALIVGLFLLTFFVADATFPVAALVTGAVIICCCIGMGQYATCQ